VNTLLIAFCASCVLTFLLIRYQNLHGHISGDHDLSGPQKIHTQSVPRIGGAGIALGLLLGSIYIAIKDDAFNPIGFILLACIPVFGIGLAEDLLKKYWGSKASLCYCYRGTSCDLSGSGGDYLA
jgi:UDP-N-acetylmuramyl pentapeptide phosphotransferase/UDP-N-acetylglucosamine-1-phosphate transferase